MTALPPPEPKARVDHLDVVPILQSPPSFESVVEHLSDLEELAEKIEAEDDTDLIGMNLELTPNQIRMMQEAWEHVIDHHCEQAFTMLMTYFSGILNLFGESLEMYERMKADGVFDQEPGADDVADTER